MQYGHITGLDKQVSRLIQGTVYFSDENPDPVFDLFDTVFATGCNTFDTAHGYGEGASERVLGKWIASRDNRDDVVIITKGAHPYNGRNRVTPEDIRTDIAESLERLDVDHIDIYLLHRDDPAYPVEPIVEVLNEHHEKGLLTVYGGSNWSHERVAEANAYAERNALQPFTVSSPQMSLAEMVKPAWEGCISVSGNADAIQWYMANPVSLLTWSSIAGGFMTGKFQRHNLDIFANYFDKITVEAYAYEDNFKRLERAEALAAEKGVSVAQIGLAYVLNHPLKPFTLVGSRSKEELADTAAAIDLTLTTDEMRWLNLQ